MLARPRHHAAAFAGRLWAGPRADGCGKVTKNNPYKDNATAKMKAVAAPGIKSRRRRQRCPADPQPRAPATPTAEGEAYSRLLYSIGVSPVARLKVCVR